MASTKQIDTAFAMAGFSMGLPTLDNVPHAIFPHDMQRIALLFSDVVVGRLLVDNGEDPELRSASANPGFVYTMASSILQHILNSGVTTEGRPQSLSQITIGGISSTYESSESYRESLRSRISDLSKQGRAFTSGQ